MNAISRRLCSSSEIAMEDGRSDGDDVEKEKQDED